MNVRLAVERDIPGMHRVRMSVTENVLRTPSRVQPEHYRRLLGDDGRGWVCEAEDRIVGFAIADLPGRNVWALFVHAAWQGRGIGRRLHDVMLDCLFETGLPSVWLSTDPGTRAERFYIRAGWRYAGPADHGEARYEMTRERWLTARRNQRIRNEP